MNIALNMTLMMASLNILSLKPVRRAKKKRRATLPSFVVALNLCIEFVVKIAKIALGTFEKLLGLQMFIADPI